jgi:single-strand DNA-binding protein
MLNKVMLIGRLGSDPKSSRAPSGDLVVDFSIAIDESYKKNGERVQKTEWVSIVVWKKLAEICEQYLTKGKLVYIEGKMQTRKWEDKDGATHMKTDVIASNMKMLDRKEGTDAPLDDVPF